MWTICKWKQCCCYQSTTAWLVQRRTLRPPSGFLSQLSQPVETVAYARSLYKGEAMLGASRTIDCFRTCFLLLSERTPLERCCVRNMSPFISSSGLSPGSREAKVQRAKVCLNCTEPNVSRSSYWSLPVGQYLPDSCCKGSVVILARWTASSVEREYVFGHNFWCVWRSCMLCRFCFHWHVYRCRQYASCEFKSNITD